MTTLQERLQREARENLENFCFEDIFSDDGVREFNDIVDKIISRTISETLKEAVRVIEGEKVDCEHCGGDGYNVEADPNDQSGQTPMQVQCNFCHAEGHYIISTAITAVEGLQKE